MAVGLLGGIGQLGGQGSSFGNAGGGAVGDTMTGAIDMSGPTVNFAGAGGTATSSAGGLGMPGMTPNTMVIVAGIGLVALLMWKRKK